MSCKLFIKYIIKKKIYLALKLENPYIKLLFEIL